MFDPFSPLRVPVAAPLLHADSIDARLRGIELILTDLSRRAIRCETRLVRLMLDHGLDTDGNVILP